MGRIVDGVSVRRRVGAYWDLGPAFVPPRPSGTAMVDRADGNTYFLTETAGGATPPIVMSLLPTTWKDQIYPAFQGPVMSTGAGKIRLYVTSGALQNEAAPATMENVDFSPIMTRRSGAATRYYEVTAGVGFAIGDALTLTERT